MAVFIGKRQSKRVQPAAGRSCHHPTFAKCKQLRHLDFGKSKNFKGPDAPHCIAQMQAIWSQARGNLKANARSSVAVIGTGLLLRNRLYLMFSEPYEAVTRASILLKMSKLYDCFWQYPQSIQQMAPRISEQLLSLSTQLFYRC